MTNDQERAFKKDLIDHLDKAKGRLQQSFPEIQQLIKTSVNWVRSIPPPPMGKRGTPPRFFYGLNSFGVRSYFFFDDHFHFFTAVLTFKSAQLSL